MFWDINAHSGGTGRKSVPKETGGFPGCAPFWGKPPFFQKGRF